MKALAALSLVSGFAVGGDSAEHALDHSHVDAAPSVQAPPEHLFSTEPTLANNYVGWSKFNAISDVDSFKGQVVGDTDNVWVVAFIHHTCGACQRLSNEWDQLKSLESINGRKVKFGYVDIDAPASQDIIKNHAVGGSVQYTPTVLVYGQDKLAPVEYTGEYLS